MYKRQAELLDPADILRVYAGGGKVYAVTERGEFALRMRLYEAERRLEGGAFARISNAELINLDRVRACLLYTSACSVSQPTLWPMISTMKTRLCEAAVVWM